jgi:MFS family permease
MKPLFYGWKIVMACMAMVTISWSLGIFGMGVYIYSLTKFQGFSVSMVSAGITSTYLMGALLSVSVGKTIAKHGPRLVVGVGALALGTGVALMPVCSQNWHVIVSFLVLGLGTTCLSINTVGSTLAPWFERHQGRAMSTSMLGASIGGMISTPLLMGGVKYWGFQATAWTAATVAVAVVLPLAVFVLRTRPQDMGLTPDGLEPEKHQQAPQAVAWSLKSALATRHFKTVVIAFGLGLMVQVGFLSHHVPIAIPVLGVEGAALVVFCAGVTSFTGRLLLARYADHVNVRTLGSFVLLTAGLSLLGLAILPFDLAFYLFSMTYGLTVGNVTTLSPIIVRREFGAASFGIIYGAAAALIQLSMALGPSIYGVIRDTFGSYVPVLLLCAAFNIIGAFAAYWGGRRRLQTPASSLAV